MRSLAFVTLLAATLAPRPAAACSCVEVPPQAAFDQHPAVFEGRVIELYPADDPGGVNRVVLEVVQQWKGIDHERVELTTPAASSMCGVRFEVETSWLIYADQTGDALYTDICQRTRRIEDAAEDLAVLGAGVTPVDVTEEDEVEPNADPAPARAGCASCALASDRAPLSPLSLLVIALVVVRRTTGRPRAQ